MRKVLNVSFNNPNFCAKDFEECPKLTSLVEDGWDILSTKRIYDFNSGEEELKPDYNAEFRVVLAK